MDIECFALVDNDETVRKYVTKNLRFTLRAVDVLWFTKVEGIEIVRYRFDSPDTGRPIYSKVAKYALGEPPKDLDEYNGPALVNKKYLLFPSMEVLETLDITAKAVRSKEVIFLTDGYGVRELATDFNKELRE